MKRFLTAVMCALTLLTTVFVSSAEATVECTLEEGVPYKVTLTAGEEAWCTFVPEFSGKYLIYSDVYAPDGTYDTKAYLYDAGYNELNYNDDGGTDRNFKMVHDLEAGQTYYIKAFFYSAQTEGSFYVVAEMQFALPKMQSITINAGELAIMEVVGKCTLLSGTTYQWYRSKDGASTSESLELTPVSCTTPLYVINNCNRAGHYICHIVNGERTEDVNFYLGIENGFWTTINNGAQDVFFVGSESKTLEVNLYGSDTSGMTYEWYATTWDTSEVNSVTNRIATVYSPTFVVDEPYYKYLTCVASDRYYNESRNTMYLHNVTETMYAGQIYSYEDRDCNYETTYFFTPTQNGTYHFYSVGDSDPKVGIYTTDGFEVTSADDNASGRNFDASAELEAGETYYVRIYIYSVTKQCDVHVEGPGTVTAVNAGKGINVSWVSVPGAVKYNLYRRVKGTTNWTDAKIASNLTVTTYEDTDKAGGLKMGNVYEYAIRYHDGSKWSSYGPVTEITRNPFVDVRIDASYFKQVSWAKNNGIVSGLDDTHFGPNDNCQRQQFCIMLWRFANNPSGGSSSNPFVDIGGCKANVRKAILWAYGQGIIKGTKVDGKTYFKPADPISREQIIIMLWRFAGKPKVTQAQIDKLKADCSDNWDACNGTSIKAIAWAYAKGVYVGEPNGSGYIYFRPKDDCSREELCIFLYNFNKKIKKYK